MHYAMFPRGLCIYYDRMDNTNVFPQLTREVSVKAIAFLRRCIFDTLPSLTKKLKSRIFPLGKREWDGPRNKFVVKSSSIVKVKGDSGKRAGGKNNSTFLKSLQPQHRWLYC